MGNDGRLDLTGSYAELAVARAQPGCEELLLEHVNYLPADMQRIDVIVGNAIRKISIE